MAQALYYGWLGHKNLGDEALFCAGKTIFQGINFTKYDSRLAMFRRPKACILGGGTYVYDWDSPTIIAKIQAKMPFIFYGVGVKNPSYWEKSPYYIDTVKEWHDILSGSPFVGLRGPDSLATLKEHGFHDAIVIGDPALHLADDSIRPRIGKRIGINFGDTGNELWGNDDTAIFEFFYSLVKLLKCRNYDISFFATCPEDTKALAKLQKETNVTELHVHYQYKPSVLDYFKSIDIFVGMKLHSVILAHCAFTPAIMVEYRPKCRDYMLAMEMPQYDYRCDDLNQQTMIDAVIKLSEDSRSYQEQLSTKISEFKRLQQAFSDRVTQYIKEL